ncbi:MAG: rRNA maturation RNase YbeY [Acidobacteriota bacterium]|nr:rRNA maturation RNase YbeY [Acidobacteriota bacterium]
MNRQRRVRVDSSAVKIFCAALAESLSISNREFSVIFVGETAIRRLNDKWRKKDHATDVLSFAYGGEIVDGLPFLGEIVIAPEIAASRAAEYGVSPEREMRKLIVHGTLHLLGYDHETDNGEMDATQNRLMRRRFFTDGPELIRLKKDL